MTEQGPEIGPGSLVTLHLSLTLEDGTEVLTTFDEEPLTLTLGDGTLQAGFELALMGLKATDEQTLTLTPDQTYGWHEADRIHEMPLSDFPGDAQPEVGQLIAFTLPDGQETAGLVREVSEQAARVDFNHPLAGHDLVFRARILAVENPA